MSTHNIPFLHIKKKVILNYPKSATMGWLVGCFGFNGPLRQYFSLYRAISQREGERGEKGYRRVKMSKQPPPAPTASAVGPCPTVIQIVGRPGTGSLPSTIAPPDHPCNYGICSKGLKKEFETAAVNEPSVFEPLKFFCKYHQFFFHLDIFSVII